MISVQEAKQLVLAKATPLAPQNISLYTSTGLVLAQDIHSATDMPPFHQSAMDGYAIRYSDFETKNQFTVTGQVPAGSIYNSAYLPGTAIRIYTGAPVPDGYDTVVMQEKTNVSGHTLVVTDVALQAGANIRLQASQTKKNEIALKAGATVTPGVAGLIAGIGINTVQVYPLPKVSVINTGNELAEPGTALQPGQVYESNSYSLHAALQTVGIVPQPVSRCPDVEEQIVKEVLLHIGQCNILILSGGVSVGDYDFVHTALGRCGVERIFHKVKQKPGKPLYFGIKNKTLVFGLPGNPAAVLSCFYEYIAPAIKKMSGHTVVQLSKHMPIEMGYTKKSGLTHFLKGCLNGSSVLPLHAQESYLMNSFALANCIIQLDEEKTEFKAGDLVEVHPF